MNMENFEGPRGTRPEEIDRVIELINLVFRPETHSMQDEYPCIYRADNAENLRIMLHRGRPVSHIGFMVRHVNLLGVRLKVGSVGGVCTHVDYRGKGLATILLGDVEETLRSRGADVVLISGPRGLYTRNGFAKAGLTSVFYLTSAAAQRLDAPGVEIRSWKDADPTVPARIYEKEPVRYERTPEEFAALLKGQFAGRRRGEVFTVLREGRAVAYFILSSGASPGEWNLWEYAGDRAAVAGGLALFLAERAGSQILARIPWNDAEVLEILRSLGLDEKPATFLDHTIKILDFARFMEKMRPVFEKNFDAQALSHLRFETRGTGGSIRRDGDEYALEDSHAAAKLVFSCPEEPTERRAKSAGGVLGEGLNYV